MRHAVRTALLSILLVGPAGAQGQLKPSPGPAFALFRPAPAVSPARPDSLIHSRTPDHRWEGIVIGGAIGAVFLGYVANGFCGEEGSNKDCFLPTLAAVPIGFVVGGSVGGLVGLLIPKGHSESGP